MPTDYRREATGRLNSSFKLSDGTDISRMTVDEITVRQRKLSPKFPDVATVLVRRQKRREELAARILLASGVGSFIASLFVDNWQFCLTVTGFSMVGFIATCIVAGTRAHDRAGASGNPF